MQKNDNNKNIRCSFCGKTQDSVDKIVAGQEYIFVMNVYKYAQIL